MKTKPDIKKKAKQPSIPPSQTLFDDACTMLLNLDDDNIDIQEVKEIGVTFIRSKKIYYGVVNIRLKIKDTWVYQVECTVKKQVHHRFITEDRLMPVIKDDVIIPIEESLVLLPR